MRSFKTPLAVLASFGLASTPVAAALGAEPPTETDPPAAAEEKQTETAEKKQTKAAEKKPAKTAEKKQAKTAQKQQTTTAEEEQTKAEEEEEQAKAEEEEQAKAEEEEQAKAAEPKQAKAAEPEQAEAEKQQAKAAEPKQAEAEKQQAKAAEPKQAKAEKQQAKAAEPKQAKASEPKQAKAEKQQEATAEKQQSKPAPATAEAEEAEATAKNVTGGEARSGTEKTTVVDPASVTAEAYDEYDVAEQMQPGAEPEEGESYYMPVKKGEMSAAAKAGMTNPAAKPGEPVSPSVRAAQGYGVSWFEQSFVERAWSGNRLAIQASLDILERDDADDKTRALARKRLRAHRKAQARLEKVATRSALDLSEEMQDEDIAALLGLRTDDVELATKRYRKLLSNQHNDLVSLYERCTTECESQNTRRYARDLLPMIRKHDTPHAQPIPKDGVPAS